MAHDPDPRLLRAFVAVAQTLHFTRAAAQLYVAQQALSRDIRRLEREVGAALFDRTTRQVVLTSEGERLLPYARAVLAAYDELRTATATEVRPLVVDAGAPVSTGQRVLDHARERAPEVEFVARYRSGLAGAVGEIRGGQLDVSFGRYAGLGSAARNEVGHQLLRFERLFVLLPDSHRLAACTEVPMEALAGEVLYAGEGDAGTAEWTDYARTLFADFDVQLAPPFPKIDGSDEFVRVVRRRGWSVLASEVFIAVPGMVLRPLTAPVPFSPVSMVWRQGLRHPGLDALRAATADLSAREGWLDLPPYGWLPAADRTLLRLNTPRASKR